MNTISKTKLVLLAVVLMLLLLIFTQVNTPEGIDEQVNLTGEEIILEDYQGELFPFIKKAEGSGAVYDPDTWVTYTNTNLGFELKHPKDWVVVEDEENTVRFGPYRDDVIGMPWWSVEKFENVSFEEVVAQLQERSDRISERNNEVFAFNVSTSTPKTFKGKQSLIISVIVEPNRFKSLNTVLMGVEKGSDIWTMPIFGIKDDRPQYYTSYYQGLLSTFKAL